MSVGKQIRLFRKKAGLTQEQLAESLDVSFQAVSSWENEVYLPDVERLTKIAECLGIGVNRLLEETKLPEWTLRERLADEAHMHTMLKAMLKHGGWSNAYRALGFIDTCCTADLAPARRAMHTACHALALEIANDEVLTLLLLAGLAKEKNIPEIETALPEEYRDDFRALTCDNAGSPLSPEAQLAQCIDCVFVLSTAAIDLSRPEAVTVVNKAEQMVLPLLKTLKNEKPEWNNAVYLLRYQILALIEAFKRLL